jgi:hypothetical protein
MPPAAIALPPQAELRGWLTTQRRPREPRGWLWRKLFGDAEPDEPFIGVATGIDCGFFRRHGLFSAIASRDVLPFPALPSGSWGIFATDERQNLRLLKPDDDSVSALLLAEARPLDEAAPHDLAQVICDIWLRRATYRHSVVTDSAALENFGDGAYAVDRAELAKVAPAFRPPSIQVVATVGDTYRESSNAHWRLEFTTAYGWMHDQQELGVETIDVSSRFSLSRSKRRVLSKRIFARTPNVRY